MWGIDVSRHQGVVNWREVHSQGIQYAILKLMHERTHEADAKFEFNYEQSGLFKLRRGAYIYVIATNAEEAIREANDALKILHGRPLEKNLWLDMEDSKIKNLGKAKLSEIIKIEVAILESAGYEVGIYSNLDWYQNVLDGENLSRKYKWWLARYPKGDNGIIKLTLRPGKFADIWQYSSKGSVEGITGNVDMDFDNVDLDKDNITVAYEVLAGKWGTGNVRVNRLTAAGYNFRAIQDKVNELYHAKEHYLKYTGLSFRIDEVFKAIGVEDKYIGSKGNRRPIAYANGMDDYNGTLIQNLKLISLAKEGKLKRPKE